MPVLPKSCEWSITIFRWEAQQNITIGKVNYTHIPLRRVSQSKKTLTADWLIEQIANTFSVLKTAVQVNNNQQFVLLGHNTLGHFEIQMSRAPATNRTLRRRVNKLEE